MSTGDVKNNLRKLLTELKQIRYPEYDSDDDGIVKLDINALANGLPQAFLPILHFVFLDYSYALAQFLAEQDYELYAKTDLRFIEVVYKILRDEFSFKPQLSKEQFLSLGFAERKIILVSDILKLCRDKHSQLNPKMNRMEKKKAQPGATMKLKKSTHPAGLHVPVPAAVPVGQKKSARQNEAKSTQKLTKKPLAPKNQAQRVYASAGTSKRSAFPAPLLVNTEMNSFNTNEEAILKFGFGSSYPLVTREIQNDAGNTQVENKENLSREYQNNGCRKAYQQERFAVPNMVERKINPPMHTQPATSSTDQQNAGLKDNSCAKQQKSVRWEDEVKYSDSSTSVAVRDHFTVPPSNFTSAKGVTAQPVPAPVTMVTIPQPSPDLMLTPISKPRHLPIPLSATRREVPSDTNVSLVDISNSDSIPQEHILVVRHPHVVKMKTNEKSHGEMMANTKSKGMKMDDTGKGQKGKDDFTHLLGQQLTEIQEKFDTVMSLNNQMSSRIVLLETRVKLLEEGQSRQLCMNYSSPTHDLQLPPAQLERHHQHNSIHKQNSAGANSLITQRFRSDVVFTQGANAFQKETQQAEIDSNAIISISSDESASSGEDEDEGTSNVSPRETPTKDQCGSSHNSNVDTSLMHTPKVSFVDSSTKATVLNVHKRLKETRQMLTRTNKSFATRFSHAQLSEDA